MEEAIDTNAFQPDFSTNDPVVVWSGPPHKIRETTSLLPVLESIHKIVPFKLRIVSGTKPPSFKATFPVEWVPFCGSVDGTAFRGATIAFARYANNEYFRCKGNYKIKTYLAAGCAVVTSPIGYNLDMIHPGVNGFFASTPEEWEAAFLQLLRDPVKRLAMRKVARETAIRRFSYDAVARQYARVLSENGLVN